VLAHRLVLTPEAIAPGGAEAVIGETLERVPAL
jgi:hypothetical protein